MPYYPKPAGLARGLAWKQYHADKKAQVKNEVVLTGDVHADYKLLDANTSGYFEVQLDVIGETEKAMCFDKSRMTAWNKPVWVPKSQMQILDLGSDVGKRYFVKNWLQAKFN